MATMGLRAQIDSGVSNRRRHDPGPLHLAHAQRRKPERRLALNVLERRERLAALLVGIAFVAGAGASLLVNRSQSDIDLRAPSLVAPAQASHIAPAPQKAPAAETRKASAGRVGVNELPLRSTIVVATPPPNGAKKPAAAAAAPAAPPAPARKTSDAGNARVKQETQATTGYRPSPPPALQLKLGPANGPEIDVEYLPPAEQAESPKTAAPAAALSPPAPLETKVAAPEPAVAAPPAPEPAAPRPQAAIPKPNLDFKTAAPTAVSQIEPPSANTQGAGQQDTAKDSEPAGERKPLLDRVFRFVGFGG